MNSSQGTPRNSPQAPASGTTLYLVKTLLNTVGIYLNKETAETRVTAMRLIRPKRFVCIEELELDAR